MPYNSATIFDGMPFIQKVAGDQANFAEAGMFIPSKALKDGKMLLLATHTRKPPPRTLHA